MGPLAGIRVIELAGLGPAPFGAMLLGDLGAEVIRIDRPGATDLLGLGRLTCRNRRSIGLNLKDQAGVDVLLDLIETADVVIEGLRPGVVERLGLSPEVCHGRNERLIFARMTGWGQDGPLRDRAGHDINYIAVTGALDAIGPPGGKPTPPLNLVGDFGGGALYLAMGILAALLERETSGRGQVVDAAMVDGAASLMTLFYELQALGLWPGSRGTNLLDGGAPFYDTYETADGGWMAVGALEPQFFAMLVGQLELSFDPADQYDRTQWPELRRLIAAAFLAKDRNEWADEFSASDACVWPVLSMAEAPDHPLNVGRQVFTRIGGVAQAAPAPRFSRTPADTPGVAPQPGEHTDEILATIGRDPQQVLGLRDAGVVF